MADNAITSLLTGTVQGYTPTWRERSAGLLQNALEALAVDRYRARKIAETVLGGQSSNLPMGFGLADATPVGAIFGRQEASERGTPMGPGAPPGLLASALPAFTRARSSAKILDPKAQAQRPFHADYPQGTTGAAGSRLATDIDGRPLSAEYIFGRRTVGGMDEGGSAADTAAVLDRLGVSIRPATSRELGGDAGKFARSGPSRSVAVDQGLNESQFGRVLQHEAGHAIDDLTFGSAIPTKGIDKPLRALYEELNTPGWFRPGRGARPEATYTGEDVQRELIAEAVRAYIRDPNYIKTKYPEVAKRIREYVNNNPNLNRVVQFNSLLAASLGAGAALSGGDEEMR